MHTIDFTAANIAAELVIPALGEYAAEHDVQAIVSDLIDAAPLHTWRIQGSSLGSDLIDDDTFWTIVARRAL